jgi:hypothetical protein
VARDVEVGEHLAHDRLARAAGVRVGVVEEVDAGLVGGLDDVGDQAWCPVTEPP